MRLDQWWQSTWSDLKLPTPEPRVLARLLARYAEPHRAYHTAQHLAECCQHFSHARALARDPGAVQLALWFHDAIYDTRSPDNEEQSAAWAVQVLAKAGAPEPLRGSVAAMVIATKHDVAPASPDAALTVDIDLSILGAPAGRFDEYETQIRQEYAWVPDETFRGARARILAEFLARPRIYLTDHFHRSLEARARSNLQASLVRLGA